MIIRLWNFARETRRGGIPTHATDKIPLNNNIHFNGKIRGGVRRSKAIFSKVAWEYLRLLSPTNWGDRRETEDGIDKLHTVEEVGFQYAETSHGLDENIDGSVRYLIDMVKIEKLIENYEDDLLIRQ